MTMTDRPGRPARGPVLPRPFVVAAPAGHPRHLHARAGAGRRRADGVLRRAVHDDARVRRRGGADLDQRRPGAHRPAGAHDPRRRRRHPRPRPRRARHRARHPRPVRHRVGGVVRPGWRRRLRRRRHRARAAAPGGPRAVRRRVPTTAGCCSSTAPAPRRTSSSATTCGAGARDHGVDVQVTVDNGQHAWRGRVGLVTQLVARGGFDASNTLALVCGPEVMMRYAASALAERGVRPAAPAPVDGTEHEVRRGPVRALPAARAVPLRRRPGARLRRAGTPHGQSGAVAMSIDASHGSEHLETHGGGRRWRSGSSPRATAASSRSSTARTS